MSNQNSGNTKAPDYGKLYKEGIQTDLQFLPKQLAAELGYRQQYSPLFTQQALDLQHQFDPSLANEQLSALNRRDPQWLAMHQSLGDKIQQALSQGYIDPRQEAAYGQLAGLAGKVDPAYAAMYAGMAGKAGQVDPRYAAAYDKLSGLAGKSDATRAAAYKALGNQVTGDTLRGTTADPATLRQMTQAILSRSPNLSYGEAQDQATAVYVGQRGQQLQQQRQAATGNFLQQATPLSQQQQSLGQFSQILDPTRMSQQSYLQGLSALDPTRMSQQSLGQFYGMNAPEMQAYGLAGTYIQPSNSVTGAINQIQGVTAPTALQYVNPNAPSQALSFGLNNFQNEFAANNQSGNPWTNALSGAATGAQYGSIGGGYGAIGGALTGAAAGAFGYPQYSTIRLKNNLSRTGYMTPDGIELVEYDMDGKRYRGVIAEEVEKVRPDAVYTFPDGLLGVFYSKLGVEQKEVN